ncbi:MAG TPA: exodeoxyribonuclease VII large subunit [Isosphaeraceae bacterium]|jgi:exodeoxyribonuclease VII large subunit|nr:exodeoxyribonuclease VII large subunit [Isosphaeraceae bacterium]
MASSPIFEPIRDPFGERLWSVSELTAMVKETLEVGFGEVGLCGEVSNLARPRSGHIYFCLKDDSAQIKAVLWKSAAQRLVFDLTDGLAVRAWGSLTIYAPRGEYQIVVRKLEPEGIGALELAFRQTVARLAAEGLFDAAHKRPLPVYPRRIVVVTSPSGAAIRDLLQVVGRRWSATEILIVPTRVQGAGAAEEVAAAIGLANQVNDADLIIVTRGGGSLEDLWAFNEEVVARAIYASRLPVVSAVGHEVDLTVADLVADRRALTPSEAGELCVPEARQVRRRLDDLRDRLARAASDHLEQARGTLDRLAGRADRAIRQQLDHRRHGLARLAAQLEALSPLAVLARGYSITLQEDGTTVLQSADSVRPGDLILTRLAAGSLTSRVESINPDREPRTKLPPLP